MATETALTETRSADNALIAMIVTAAQTNSIEIEKLKELMVMRRDILAQEAEIAFNVALNAVQAEINPVTKDGENPHAHSRYATLEKVDREIRPLYTKHGFSLTFNTGTPANQNAVHVICEVRHSGGHKKEYFLEGDLDVSGSQGKSNKTSIQGLGSSVSYLRRYLTLMIFNVTLTNEDNDGNGNREAYNAIRHAADARQAARQAAGPMVDEQVAAAREANRDPRPVQGCWSKPENIPVPNDDLREELAESITQAKLRKPKKDWTKFEILGLFREIKKKYEELRAVTEYYKVLGIYGMEKSNDFSDDDLGREKARKAYKHLQLSEQDLRAYANKQQEATDGN